MQAWPSTIRAVPPNMTALPVLGQISNTATATSTSALAVSQIPPPINAVQTEIDPNVDGTNSLESFVNLDPLLAPVAILASASNHCSSLDIANANEIHNSWLEAGDAIDQLSTWAVRITNNVPTVQTINQIIGAISDQFQAQQLGVQHETQKQIQTRNARFAALAKQMQQLISTTTVATVA
uniref:Uncharacterized protein n=1 Tax=Romanomermis culicivorax TaxID=13658 RepID=A0A915I450_ROMCU